MIATNHDAVDWDVTEKWLKLMLTSRALSLMKVLLVFSSQSFSSHKCEHGDGDDDDKERVNVIFCVRCNTIRYFSRHIFIFFLLNVQKLWDFHGD